MIERWPTVRQEELGDFRIFKLRAQIKRSPRTGAEHGFFVLDCVDWVNVVAVTPDKQLVMVEQYRHGSDTVELEVPGGMMDTEDESPLVTGVRELREETGYEGGEAVVIGQVYPNPAFLNNRCHTVLVPDCELKHATAFDHSEDLVTRLMPVGEIQNLVASGRIRHSLVVVALFHFELWQARLSKPRGQGQ